VHCSIGTKGNDDSSVDHNADSREDHNDEEANRVADEDEESGSGVDDDDDSTAYNDEGEPRWCVRNALLPYSLIVVLIYGTEHVGVLI
jgi:hypothetical protein